MIEQLRNMAGALRRSTGNVRYQAVAALAAGIVISVTSGLGIGSAAGTALMSDFMKGGGRIVPLLYRPSFQHLSATAMLGSADELKRLAGYYALLETDSIDVEFLVERYGMESSTVTRRTIVWLLGFAGNRRAAFDACAGLYRDAPAPVRVEILSSIRKLDGERYLDFIKHLEVKPKTLP